MHPISACTYDNDDDCSGNICKVLYRAFSNEHPFCRLLYLILLDLEGVAGNEGIENIVLPNAMPLNGISTSLRRPLSNYIQLHRIRIYYSKYLSLNLIRNIVKAKRNSTHSILLVHNKESFSHYSFFKYTCLLCSGTNFGINSSSLSLLDSFGFPPIRPF